MRKASYTEIFTGPIRKDILDHVRETVQFAKYPSAMMIRFVLYRHYHNCMIPWRVKEARRKKKLRKAVNRYWLKRVLQAF